MDYVQLIELEIDVNELNRNQEELEKFINKYSKNHVELKFLVSGFQMILKNKKRLNLPSFRIVKVFPFEEGKKFEIAWKKTEIFEALLAYVFQGRKNHTIRFSAGNGTIFPITRNYGSDIYSMKIMMGDLDVEKDWKSKQETISKYADYFFEHETDALPILWYGKGLISNDKTSAFLDFYRCIEILSKIYLKEQNSEIRHVIEKPLDVRNKNPEIQKIYENAGIPEKMKIPLFLEEHGIQKQTHEKWRKFRNSMTHGELTYELNDEFRQELSNLHNITKIALDAWITNYFKNDGTTGQT